MDRYSPPNPFGNQATCGCFGGVTAGPWLCAPASRRVCPFEDDGLPTLKGLNSLRIGPPNAATRPHVSAPLTRVAPADGCKMPRRAKPWFRSGENVWYATVNGRKVSLGVRGKANEAAAW